MALSKKALTWIVPSGPVLGSCCHAPQVPGIACGEAFETDNTLPPGAVPVMSLSVPPCSEPPVPTHSKTFAVATAPPFVNSISTNTSPIECEAKGSVAVSYTHLRAHETPEHLVC